MVSVLVLGSPERGVPLAHAACRNILTVIEPISPCNFQWLQPQASLLNICRRQITLKQGLLANYTETVTNLK